MIKWLWSWCPLIKWDDRLMRNPGVCSWRWTESDDDHTKYSGWVSTCGLLWLGIDEPPRICPQCDTIIKTVTEQNRSISGDVFIWIDGDVR